MVFFIYNIFEMESVKLSKKDINNLRERLNESIKNNEDYSIIYDLSVQLDDLISQYYRENCTKI